MNPTTPIQLTTLPPHARQAVVVTGDGYRTTHATLRAYAMVDDRWHPAGPPRPARIGADGFSDHHVEGVPTTPTGVYAIGPTMYGIAADPGVRYPYHRVAVDDWWNANPSSPHYNGFQRSATNPGGHSEALWREDPAYTHFAVISYNMPPTVATPVPDAGSGIFLHEFTEPDGNATAGCVSLSHEHLVEVLTWLDPDAAPHVVLTPVQHLDRY
ncbi:L,D-transpeptidase family protein [Micromonospora eburnea]|uniref:L,D-peptidoglycan transpeptidase YkuD, ErfK/YbiS/YcfS/YnhG family n=1 Tax=Micromonospora eburnea TaxID=227316 RepID=A0A1C6V302_9ACTN|nr:L,D-transpeptidase family protein [Micromonospora eburnea]SCL60497.1 L,D-peptidoglycan transpeptidase YkuD, ErfK/YbiS/YcfS/YnhG family [Micromonospora eburnea]